MENVERTHFVVLTGHLDDRPLPDLIRTLRVQKKSGRLQVEYPDAPGSFFFEDGQLVDAQLGSLRGVEALYAAVALRGASFNFNPLVRPPERSIDRQGQQFVHDLIEAPRREGLSEIKVAALPAVAQPAAELPAAAPMAELPPAPQQALVRLEPGAAAALTAPLEARLSAVEQSIVHASRRFSRERLIYAVVISFLVGLTLVTALQAILDPVRRAPAIATATAKPEALNAAAPSGEASRAASAAATKGEPAAGGVVAAGTAAGVSPQAQGATKSGAAAASPGAQSNAAASVAQANANNANAARRARKPSGAAGRGEHVVRVLMEVKNGKVTEARVLNPRPGAAASEALALRLAKQRRYPENFTGGDTWRVRVKP